MKTELDSYKLKVIAASAMLLDHIAFMFLTDTSPAGLIIHFVGRLAAPIFCFLTAEGYEHTCDLRKYLLRMAAAAVVSVPCFNYFYYGSVFPLKLFGMIYTLTLGIIAMHVWDNESMNPLAKTVFLIGLGIFDLVGDWPVMGIVMVLVMHVLRGSPGQLMKTYTVIVLIFTFLLGYATGFRDISWISSFGMLLFIPFYFMYSGELGGRKGWKYFVYIFYPAHLVLIRLIYTAVKK